MSKYRPLLGFEFLHKKSLRFIEPKTFKTIID